MILKFCNLFDDKIITYINVEIYSITENSMMDSYRLHNLYNK